MLVAAPRRGADRVRGGLPGSASLNEAAVSARSKILCTLGSWAALVRDERPVLVELRREVASLSTFLREHLEWLGAHPAAHELSAEISDVVRMAERVVHPEKGKRLEVGACQQQGCGSTVYATFSAEGSQSPTGVSCDLGHVMGPREWLLAHHTAQGLMRRADSSLIGSAEQVA